MNDLVTLIEAHGYLIVAAAVLVEQVGVPLPAFPVLIVAGALAAAAGLRLRRAGAAPRGCGCKA